MGAEQENKCVRMTRGAAAKKRAASNKPLQQQPPNKKRVVLGELTNQTLDLRSDGENNSKRNNPRSNKEPEKKKLEIVHQIDVDVVDVEEEDEEKDVDVEVHSDDPQMCVAYASDIYKYLHSMEVEGKRRPMCDYIERVQKDVTSQMRGILVDWLVEVAEEYKLVSDTLYLTVSYLDRYLSSNALNRQRLQLLGVSCMLIASKYEEISPPHVEDFCYITDNTYTKQEVVKMETDILKFLNFEMGNPTIKTFLRRFTRTAQGDCDTPNLQLEFLACYLAELSLLDYGCIAFLPSMVAASVIFLTNFTLNPKTHPWNIILEKQSGYKPFNLKDCVLAVHDLQVNRKGSSLAAIRDKYKQNKFKSVSSMTPPSEIPLEYFEDVKQ